MYTFVYQEQVSFHNKTLILLEEETSFKNRLRGPLLADDPKLASYLKENILHPPSSLPYNLTGLTSLSKEPYFDLQRHMFSIFARKTFNHSPPGFFLEAGALDGETSSNSLWLEVEKNWTGLLIEPFHANCQHLRQKHRKAWTACSCITPKNHAETTVLEIPHEYNPSSSELTWLYQANVRSVNSRVSTMEGVHPATSIFSYQKVQCFPLITYLDALEVKEIDLLSLDTQGGEKEMILSLPFDRIKIHYMFIEYYKPGPHPKSLDESFQQQMLVRNYSLNHFNPNTAEYIFVLNE